MNMKLSPTHLAIALFGGILTLFVTILVVQQPILTNLARESLFDQYQRFKPRIYDENAPVRIIDIDEKSLEKFGQWPWPRTYMAELTKRLYELDAAAIGFDVIFAEADRTSPEQLIRSNNLFLDQQIDLKLPQNTPQHDEIFAQAMRLGPTVLAVSGVDNDQSPKIKAGISYTGANPKSILTKYAGALEPLPLLWEAATGIGSISLGNRRSAIIRHTPALSNIGDEIVPSLSLELLRVAQGASTYIARTSEASGEVDLGDQQMVNMRVGALELPLASDGTVRPYYTARAPQRSISVLDILDGNQVNLDLKNEIAGRIILVGSSAAGLLDIVSTPLAEQVAGVSVHAQLIEQIIAQEFIIRPDWAIGAELVFLLIAALVIVILLMLQRALFGLALVLIFSVGALAASWWAFAAHGLLLDPLPVILLVLLLYIPTTALGFVTNQRARAALRNQFAFFLPDALISKIAEDPDAMLTPGGATRVLSVMFIDVRQFSTLTEHMSSNDVVRFVNGFLTPLSKVITKNHGTIDKYIGDAIMGFWNAPVPEDNHVSLAARSIVDMEAALANLNADYAAQGLPEIKLGIGVNTGECSVGMMGSLDRLSYSCIGDAVNLASRLEGLTKLYGVMNCIGDATAQQLDDEFILIELDLVAVKGRVQGERVYAILGVKGDKGAEDKQEFVELFAIARQAYLNRKWQKARDLFEALDAHPIGMQYAPNLVELYINRLEHYSKSPPLENWDGIYVAQEK